MTEPSEQPAVQREWFGSRRLWVVATLMGLPIGAASVAFLGIVQAATTLVWEDVPDWLGIAGAALPWWYVVAVPMIAGLVAAPALLHVGASGGHELSVDPKPLAVVPWVLLAALATLAGGFVLGPEAPLLVLGPALAALAARLGGVDDPTELGAIALAGAFTVLAVILVSPIVALVLVVEIVARAGAIPAPRLVPMLMPGLLAGGVGVLVFTGIASWGGVDAPSISIGDLPDYDTVRVADIAWSIPLVAVVVLTITVVHLLSGQLLPIVAGHPVVATGALGALVGALGAGYAAVADRPVEDILSSGEHALPEYAAISSVGVLLLIVLFKGIAYAGSLAARVEGGPIFPAIAIGAALGIAAGNLLPEAHVLPMLAAGVAAAAASMQRLPVFGLTLAIVVVGPAHATEAMLFCVIGAVAGWAFADRIHVHRHATR